MTQIAPTRGRVPAGQNEPRVRPSRGIPHNQYHHLLMTAQHLTILMGLLTLAGCAQRPDPPNIVAVSETEATVEPIEPDDPEVVRSVERMLAMDATEALKWVEAHQPAWTPAINRIYGMGVRKVVIHEYDEEFIGRVPKALIVDRGDVSVEPVQQALLDWQGEHTVLDHGWTTTSQYTVVFLY